MTRRDTAMRRRTEFVAGIVALGFALLIIRAIDLQWLRADTLRDKAEQQRWRTWTAVAPRGPILDARGRVLAESVETPSIAAMADEVPAARIPELAAALGMDAAKLRRRLQGRKGFVWLARQIAPAQARKVMALGIPGVRTETEWRRFHPLGPEAGHVLGFVGIDGHGLEGVERARDAELAGAAGIRQVRRDARGHSLPGGVWLKEPKQGKAVRLTIDASIQGIAYAALAEGVQAMQARGGSVVVMRPNDGAILAMANWPGFNPNDFRHYRPGQWRNRAVTDIFEPGSALKPFTIAAALARGRWKPDTRIFCENGAMRVADHVIHDDHDEGWLDLPSLLARSSNIGAAKLALDIGPEALGRMLTSVGFGRKPDIGLGGESPGMLPPPNEWGPVETATIAFGQGVAVTPLQLAAAFSVLANDGLRVPPRLYAETPVRVEARVLPARIARQVRAMLEFATSPEGTGKLAVPAGYEVAGKTGTAQKAAAGGGYDPDRYTAVFAGFAPARDPAIVVAVVIDEPKASIYGGQAAAPVFRRIVENALPYLGVLPAGDDAMPAGMLQSIADTTLTAPVPGRLEGLSLREVRRISARLGVRLFAHGSGWVVRHSPASLEALAPGGVLEVWLDD
ncbi:MAG: penicillin-binding transpeptidase domain-containing protein [Mariprofundaceae bacterium]